MLLLVLLIMIPALVQWTQVESKGAVKNQKATTSFNLAQAAVERGLWKIQSTTQTWADASTGTVITGYNFDVTYRDVPGGTYRILVQSSGTLTAMVTGEGRDSSNGNTRAISAVYKSQTIYSPLMATQGVTYTVALIPRLWGPIMSQGSITLNDNDIGNMYYPRKYAQDVVQCSGTCNATANSRDTNGLTPPNTDNAEWWSDYQYLPPLPVLDFAALRSSAAATGTLNVYGCNQSTTHMDTHTATTLVAGAAPWDSVAGRGACANIGDASGAHADHFAASFNHPYGANLSPAANTYVWYWDHDVILAGDATFQGQYGIGLHGTVIVRGNLTLDANGDYDYNGNVPHNAWAEYGKLTKTTGDTAATNEYPADNGFHNSLNTFQFGTQKTFTPIFGAGYNTVGIRGFTYVGGNLTITTNGFMDFNGAVWVNGSVAASGASASHYCGVFYDDTLVLPTLNVVLARQSWNEVSASTITWAP